MSDSDSPGKMTPTRTAVYEHLLQFKNRPTPEHPKIREIADATNLPHTTAYEAVVWLRKRKMIPWYITRRRGPRGPRRRNNK